MFAVALAFPVGESWWFAKRSLWACRLVVGDVGTCGNQKDGIVVHSRPSEAMFIFDAIKF